MPYFASMQSEAYMSKKMLDLSKIFLEPLISETTSFIKIVGSGTGLGKSYSSILSLKAFIGYLERQNSNKQVLAIYTAPQHNQISFPDKIVKALEKLDTHIVQVKPSSTRSQDDIESDNNAYDVASSTFFGKDGESVNAVYKSLLKAANSVDSSSSSSQNPTHFAEALKSIRFTKLNIDRLLDKILPESDIPSADDDEDSENRLFIKSSNDDNKEKLTAMLTDLSKKLQLLFLKSYSNFNFNEEIEKHFSTKSLREFRQVTSSYYPFLHYQLSNQRHVLIGMTVSKLTFKQLVFIPRFIKSRNVIKWSTKSISSSDIFNDTSEFYSKSMMEFEVASEHDGVFDEKPTCRNLFFSEIHLYIDESDSSKKQFNSVLNIDIEDDEKIQAFGALTKEVGDVLYDADYEPLLERLPEKDIDAFRYLTNGDFDDAIERQVGKDVLRKIQDVILRSVASEGWEELGDSTEDIVIQMNNKISVVARSLLTSPFCTVDAGIESSVFEMTSVFGGEMFGFVGSRYVDDFVVVMKKNAIRITSTSYLQPKDVAVPLKILFLLITVNMYIFLALKRKTGSVNTSLSIRKKILEYVNDLLKAGDNVRSDAHVTKLKKFLRSLYKTEAGSLAPISAPFENCDEYHTYCASNSIFKESALGERFNSVVSPSDVNVNDLIGEDVESFLSPQKRLIDMDFGYRKAHSIFGMVQTNKEAYAVAQDKSHVSFPIKFREKSPEVHLLDLVGSKSRRTCCFLMSATGAFSNSHIPSWSIEALSKLSYVKGVSLLNMSNADYALSSQKQKERGALKKIFFDNIDEMSGTDFELFYKQVLKNQCFEEQLNPEFSKNSFIGLHNKHKQIELMNIFKSVDYVHNRTNGDKPFFALSLTQTHRFFLMMFENFIELSLKGNNRRYQVTNLLKGGEQGNRSAGYAIFKLSTLGTNSRFEQPVRDTLVVCYSASLDKALTRIFKERFRNPYHPSAVFKKMLGMNVDEPLKDANSTDFNPLNYILNNLHGCNVIIVSAYQSAARGVNLIVNKKTQHLTSLINKEILSSNELVERDLDAVFLASPPFYSDVKPNVAKGMTPKAAQKRFFNKSDRYIQYIEWLARNHQIESDSSKYNYEIDLMSPYEDKEAESYFQQQHAISLFCELMQGLGRIERTNANQEQHVFLCRGVNEVILNGIDAITSGHNDKDIEKYVDAMSIVNSKVVSGVLDGSLNLRENFVSNISDFESNSVRFENLKRQTFLKAIERFRLFQSSDDVDENTQLEIAFYEAFRSPSLWVNGYDTYIKGMEWVLKKMPSGLQRNYRLLLNSLFITCNEKLDEYLSVAGYSIDLDKMYKSKVYASVNGYCQLVNGKYLYPAPWFIADIEGNYGELVARLSVDKLTHGNSGIKLLTHSESESVRRGYELADFFIQSGKKIIAIDAKHYLSSQSKYIQSNSDSTWTSLFRRKLQRHQEQLESIMPGNHIIVVAINTASSEESLIQIKTVGANCFVVNGESSIDDITFHLGSLMNNGV